MVERRLENTVRTIRAAHINLLTLISSLILFSLPSPSRTESYIDIYIDTSILSQDSTFSDYFRDKFDLREEITKIKYYIDLGRKENRRITLGSIKVRTTIDIEQNTAYEIIELHYVQEMMDISNVDSGKSSVERKFVPDLVGEHIYFHLETSDRNSGNWAKDLSIVSVEAHGWRITVHGSAKEIVLLEKLEDKPLGNRVYFACEIRNQDRYRGRQFDVYNRDVIGFDANIKISGDYEFIAFNPTLPYKSKAEDGTNSPEDYYDIYTDSKIMSNQVTRNKIHYSAWLQGNDYLGGDSHGGLVPEKLISFDYTYEYQEDVNAKIVEENKKATEQTLGKIEDTSVTSTWLAIGLFGISIVVSVCGVIISTHPVWFKSKISRIPYFLQVLKKKFSEYRNSRKPKSRE